MFEYKITSINKKFENIKNQVADGMTYLQAEWAVEDLLKEAEQAVLFMSEKAVVKAMKTLINELKQYLFDIQGMIEYKCGINL